ncbi:MAG: hypothetical protein HPY70_09450 [Firmicutes bacterium]|nr:hypothetical protein [Bacillota bacterium]
MKKNIYIFNDGQIRRKDNTVYFETEEGKKFLPIEDINDIFVFGELELNKRFLELASQKEITIHFLFYLMKLLLPRQNLQIKHKWMLII